MLYEFNKHNSHYFEDEYGRTQGEYKAWHMNSNVDTQAMYINGKREGEFKRWYDNGQMEINSFYVDDKRQGEYKSWWSDGQIEEHCYYKNGNYHGEYKWWYYDGSIREHWFFVNGKQMKLNKSLYPTTNEDRLYFTLKYNIPLLPVESIC